MSKAFSKDLVNKVEHGDPLDDEELWLALRFYEDTEAALALLGEKYSLARNAVWGKLHMLQGFAAARKEKR